MQNYYNYLGRQTELLIWKPRGIRPTGYQWEYDIHIVHLDCYNTISGILPERFYGQIVGLFPDIDNARYFQIKLNDILEDFTVVNVYFRSDKNNVRVENMVTYITTKSISNHVELRSKTYGKLNLSQEEYPEIYQKILTEKLATVKLSAHFEDETAQLNEFPSYVQNKKSGYAYHINWQIANYVKNTTKNSLQK